MKPSELASSIRIKTKTSATSFTDEEILTFTRPLIESYAEEIAALDEDHLGFIWKGDIEANRREYPFPVGLISIKQIEAKLNGKWVTLEEVDLSSDDLRTATDEELKDSWAGRKPAFRQYRRSFFLVTDQDFDGVPEGMKLHGEGYPWVRDLESLAASPTELDMSEQSADGLSPGLPTPFHRILEEATIIHYKLWKDRPVDQATVMSVLGDAMDGRGSKFLSALNSLSAVNKGRSIEYGAPPYPSKAKNS